jgi:hypothetical protein
MMAACTDRSGPDALVIVGGNFSCLKRKLFCLYSENISPPESTFFLGMNKIRALEICGIFVGGHEAAVGM